MDLVYNAEEIFQMGVEIEKNGLAFYTAAAKAAKNEQAKKLCEELGSWESKHVALFENLKAQLPASAGHEPVYDPDDELGLYLKAIFLSAPRKFPPWSRTQSRRSIFWNWP